MLSEKVLKNLQGSSAIRAMFEEGENLKKIHGSDKVFDFSLGNPDPPPPEAVLKSLRGLAQENPPGLHSYMNNAGHKEVREKIADHINSKDGTYLTADNIVMTCGAGGGLNVVLKAILNPGEEIIVFSPFFVEYGFYIENYGGNMVVVPAEKDTFQPDLQAIEKSITSKTKGIILNSPNNPTGVVYNEMILTSLAYLIEDKEKEFHTHIFVISDEPYRDIVYDEIKIPQILNIFKKSISVYSYSKALSLPGERIGYIAANNEMENIDVLMEALTFANRVLGFVNAPSLFQKVVAESLGTTVDVNIYQERRDLLYYHLTDLGFSCVKPQGAFYLFPKSPLEDTGEFKKMALKHKIIIVPGKGFGSPEYFRLAYCVSTKTIENSLPAFTALAKEAGLN
jgi:aspartate aminotransferase